MKKRYPVLIAVLALPAVMLLSAARTFRELDMQRSVYLRSVAAAVAGRLESAETPRALMEEQPEVVNIQVITPGSPEDVPQLRAIREGRELYRTEFSGAGRNQVFRAYVPFHWAGGLHIARIDIAANAADFLLVHARHNLIIVSVAGLVLLLVSIYGLWSARRADELQRKQMALAHLAHIGEMAAVLAHEIRNPLATIKGYTQLLAERPGGAGSPHLGAILKETARLERLVSDLLAYGRPAQPTVREIEAAEVANEFRIHLPQGVAVGHSELTLRTDPELLQHVIVNLARNGLEAAGMGAEVRVDIQPAGQSDVEVLVTDNGPGISAEAAQRIFTPFFTTKSSGTGLGLPISRRLTEALGGELTLEPAEPRGTRAVVRLRGARVSPAGTSNGTHTDC